MASSRRAKFNKKKGGVELGLGAAAAAAALAGGEVAYKLKKRRERKRESMLQKQLIDSEERVPGEIKVDDFVKIRYGDSDRYVYGKVQEKFGDDGSQGRRWCSVRCMIPEPKLESFWEDLLSLVDETEKNILEIHDREIGHLDSDARLTRRKTDDELLNGPAPIQPQRRKSERNKKSKRRSKRRSYRRSYQKRKVKRSKKLRRKK